MSHQYVVTFIGDDRTGIVERLATTIERHGGNWLESRLSQLEGKFAGLILIALDSGEVTALEADLKALPGGSWSVRVSEAGKHIADGEPDLELTVIGPDRPGIVREISSALAEVDINVVTMETDVESAPFTGEPIFRAKIYATLPEGILPADLSTRLETIADAMTLDIDIGD